MRPTPEQIKQARKDAGLTQSQAANLIYKSTRAWQQWEGGQRNMGAALWELFSAKVRAIIVTRNYGTPEMKASLDKMAQYHVNNSTKKRTK